MAILRSFRVLIAKETVIENTSFEKIKFLPVIFRFFAISLKFEGNRRLLKSGLSLKDREFYIVFVF